MFSIRLKELREKNNLSQQAFAIKMNISQSTIGMWESGKREPNFSTIQKLADYFDVSIDYLLGRTDTPKKTKIDEEITFDDFTYAMYNETKELTEEDKEALLNMARILKKKTDEK